MEKRNKEKEFEDAIVEFGPIITKICYYFSDSRNEFQDLRQEILLNLWKGWENFQTNSKLSTWIYRVSFNTCVSFYRKGKKDKNFISIEHIIDLPAETENSKLENYNTMLSLIRNLSYQERVIIMLWLEDKSYEEISDLMGINRNTLAVRIKRIKEKLIRMASKG